MSLARCRASIRCVRLRSGAADGLARAVSVGVGGMGGEYTEQLPPCKAIARNSAEARPEVDASSGDLTPDGAICSGFFGLRRVRDPLSTQNFGDCGHFPQTRRDSRAR